MRINLEIDMFSRGREFWKFNKTLLDNQDFIDKIKIIIDEITNKEENRTLNPAQLWKLLKFEIGFFSQEQTQYIAN